MPEVVALGDVNVDIIGHFSMFPGKGEDALASSTEIHCGGSAANTAMALARLGVDTALIARVGPDSWALKAYSCLNEAGVAATLLQRDPAAMTGLMYVVVTADGERTILGHRGANVHTDPDLIREGDLAEARVFHLSAYALLADPQRRAALRALEMARRHKLMVTVDPGMSLGGEARDELISLLPGVDILLPNLAEAQNLTGCSRPEVCVQSLLDAGVRVVALKLGAEGSLIGHGKTQIHVPGIRVTTKDSTGAGDCFAAGLIAGHLGGLDWRESALLGNALGAMAATRVGAGTSVPQPADVLALLRIHYGDLENSDYRRTARRVLDWVRTLAEKPEEGRPWWT